MLCKVHTPFAYAMLVYVVASVFYVVATRVSQVGTPFNDTLTEEQREVKNASAAVRRRIFWTGVAVGCVGAYLIKPFSKC